MRPFAQVILVMLGAFAAVGCSLGPPGDEVPTTPVTEVGGGPATTPAAPEEPQDPPKPAPRVPGCVGGPQLQLCAAATDNYKASFNEDPSQRELRTWLTMHAVRYRGVRYVPDHPDGIGGIEVPLRPEQAGTEGQLASLRIETAQGADNVGVLVLRLGPQPRQWGPLLQLNSADALVGQPVAVRITAIDRSGAPAAAMTATYRHDPALAGAPEGNLEHNGPGGRWHLEGTRTQTNVELGWE